MIYTEQECVRWWNMLSRAERVEILSNIEDRADSRTLRELAANAYARMNKGEEILPRHLVQIRKWAK